MRRVPLSTAARKLVIIGALIAAVTMYVTTTISVFSAPSDPPVPLGVAPRRRTAAPSDDCSSRASCLSCLFDTVRGVRLQEKECVWCAGSGRCVDENSAAGAACEDVEDFACPSVLHSKVPQNHRVIHVGIRKGGPEALVQLHLALVHWGFTTTLDTRKSKKEKGGPVMPFFLTSYHEEFSKAPPLRWVRDYEDWHSSGVDGDVLIATETWMCKNDPSRYLPNGVRQMQWHLTVWPRRDRSQCTIAGHTRYVASAYMRQSERALMFPYVSPHIVALAASQSDWSSKKEDIVLYDSDTKLTDHDLISNHGVSRVAKIASGYTPEQLYALYGRAKAGIDLQLPGGERFVYEAALFDVCLIVDRALNGLDTEDFPLPMAFRVPPGNLTALNAAVDQCVANYSAVAPLFAPLKWMVLRQRTTFLRHVRQYFSNSVHVVGVVCSQDDADRFVMPFIVATLLQTPFAVVEIQIPFNITLNEKHPSWVFLHDNSWLAAVIIHRVQGSVEDTASCASSSHRSFIGNENHNSQPQTSPKRSLVTLITHVTTVVLHHEFVPLVSSMLALRRDRSPVVALEFPVARKDTESTSSVLAVLTEHVSRCAAEASCVMEQVAAGEPVLLGGMEGIASGAGSFDDVREFFCRHEAWRTVSPHGCG
jgi:hypothetical protein